MTRINALYSLFDFTPGLSPEDLCTQIGEVNIITALGRRLLALCLFDMQHRKVYALTGHRNAAHYAETKHGMSRRSAQEYVNVGTFLNDLSELDAALVAGDISWSKMKILIRVVVRETQSEWLERAEELNTEQLSKDVARCIPGQRPKKPGEGGLPDIYMRVTGNLLLVNHEMWEAAKRKLSAECGRTLSNEDMMIQYPRMLLCTDSDGTIKGRTKVKHSAFQLIIHSDAEGARVHTGQGDVELSAEQADRLMEQADLVPAARPIKNPEGKTPNWQVRRVKARDNNCCQNCGERNRVQVHHVEFRADGGKTEEDLLASLCDLCHSMVHQGLLNLHGNAKDGFVFLDRSGERVDRPRHYGDALHPEDQVHIVPLPQEGHGGGESKVEMLRRMMIYSVRRELVPGISQTFRGYRLRAAARGDG